MPADPLDLAPDQERALRRAHDVGFRPPMLATLTHDPFSDRGWIFERKLDGVRMIATRERGETPRLWSRNRKSMDASYPEIVEALDEQGPERFVVDGEIVAFEDGRTSFARLQSRMHLSDPGRARRTGVAVYCYLFDLLVLDDVDLTRVALRSRKAVLSRVVGSRDPLRHSEHRNGSGREYLADACSRGWEGLIAKRADAAYSPGRSRDWLKLKCVRDQEFVIGGWTDPSGARHGLGALLVGYYAGGELRYAGKVGTGYDEATLRSLRSRLDDLGERSSPFADVVREKGQHWVRPELVCAVGFSEWTTDGRLRHPRFQGLRIDKDPREVAREQ